MRHIILRGHAAKERCRDTRCGTRMRGQLPACRAANDKKNGDDMDRPLMPAVNALEDSTYRKVALRLIPFLLLCYVVAYLDRVNVGFAKLQMQSDLDLTDTVYGLGAGVFFIGYFIFEIPSNIILHRVGARLWIARIMITWGVLSALTMFVTGAQGFYAMRFLLGVAEAGFFPGIILYLTYWYPAQRRGRIVAMFMTAVAISGVVGGPLSGWILKSLPGVLGLAGWQWLFLIEGLPSALIGILVLVVLDDGIAKARWLTDQEKALLTTNIAADQNPAQQASLPAALSNPRVWVLALIYFCLVMGLYGLSFWLPSIIKALGVKDVLDISLLTAIPNGCAVIAMVLVARSADRHRERRWHIAISALVGAVGLALSVIWHDSPALSMVGLCLGTMGILSSIPLFWSMPTAFLASTGAAAGIAFINSIGNLAGFASPYAVGWIKDHTHSTDLAMYLLAVMLLLGGVLTMTMPTRLVDK
jgi:D-galactonate transporter